ncbi:helix-turn-helix transcriptional regulator [Lactobacillus sp. 3B(2020)]|uniref:helix-turn-helix transcriptional regulator n=1 Tax=Lactobacillus sp. 3B(2020) TaxID=2695882 RepID=UPI0015DE20A7|nr:helix-turn-helix transcriptional regulator [Lactobacillus sp. 3B(2020)]
MSENIISSQIKAFRKKRGWTQVQLAEKMNVSTQTVSNWENGIKFPRMGTLQKLADLFGVEVGDITSNPNQSILNGLSVDEAVDNLRAYQGKPISDSEKEVLKDIIKGYLDRR